MPSSADSTGRPPDRLARPFTGPFPLQEGAFALLRALQEGLQLGQLEVAPPGSQRFTPTSFGASPRQRRACLRLQRTARGWRARRGLERERASCQVQRSLDATATTHALSAISAHAPSPASSAAQTPPVAAVEGNATGAANQPTTTATIPRAATGAAAGVVAGRDQPQCQRGAMFATQQRLARLRAERGGGHSGAQT